MENAYDIMLILKKKRLSICTLKPQNVKVKDIHKNKDGNMQKL